MSWKKGGEVRGDLGVSLEYFSVSLLLTNYYLFLFLIF